MAPLRHAAAGRVPEIADLGGVRTAALADSPWWAGLRRRLTPIGQAPAGRASGTLDATLEKLESAAATRLAFATWHGDWGPWNLRSTPGRLLVWDWERSGDGVPLGFDLLHFGYQTALQDLGQPAAVAAATARDRGDAAPGRAGPAAGSRSCCSTCTCWNGSAAPPRSRCRRSPAAPIGPPPTCSSCSGGASRPRLVIYLRWGWLRSSGCLWMVGSVRLRGHGDANLSLARLGAFRAGRHACCPRRADALFELGDALVWTPTPVPSLPHLSLEPVHQRGWGSVYAALAHGEVDAERLRDLLVSQLPPADPLM